MLQYRLLEGRIDLEPLRILASRQTLWAGRRVTFFVLGASHAVVIERDNSVVTELLACALPVGQSRVLAERAGDTAQSLCLRTNGLRYEARLSPFSAEDGDTLRAEFPDDNRLDVAYPVLPDGATPVTRVGWRLSESQLRVETIHTYPEERRGVYSCSVFSLEDSK